MNCNTTHYRANSSSVPGDPTEAVLPIHSGDVLFFYTDGLIEAENGRQDMFGADRLQTLLAAEHTHGVDTILQRVEEAVKSFRGQTEPFDDATMMVLRVGD